MMLQLDYGTPFKDRDTWQLELGNANIEPKRMPFKHTSATYFLPKQPGEFEHPEAEISILHIIDGEYHPKFNAVSLD